MPKFPRSQLVTRCKQSAQDHINYEKKMRVAVEDVIQNKLTIKFAALKHDISKSALHRKVQKYKHTDDNFKESFNFNRSHGFKTIFNAAEEELLNNYLIQASEMCYGLSLNHTRQLAYQYAIANEKQVPQSWHNKQTAGLEWMHMFRKRHPTLSLRKPEPTSLTRATSFNKHNVGLSFTNLKDVIRKFGFQAHQILNCDETGVTTVHRPPKVLSSIKQKQVGKVTSAERGTLVTVCVSICANCTFVPPFFIFPRKNFKEIMISGAPQGSNGAAHPSGWMTGVNFVHYIQHFI
jgi:hypothetical protein